MFKFSNGKLWETEVTPTSAMTVRTFIFMIDSYYIMFVWNDRVYDRVNDVLIKTFYQGLNMK